MRRRVGVSLCVAGGLTLSLAGGRYAMGAVKADAARAEWDRREAEHAVARVRATALATDRAEPLATGAPVARVIAPKIALDAVVLEGVDGDELNALPGHLPGSALPGDRGNAIISAHRDRHFNRLGELDVGDTLTTEAGTRAGMRTTRWIIVAKRVVSRNSPALFHTPDATLTLTTCWPMRYVGPAPERLIITAKPVS